MNQRMVANLGVGPERRTLNQLLRSLINQISLPSKFAPMPLTVLSGDRSLRVPFLPRSTYLRNLLGAQEFKDLIYQYLVVAVDQERFLHLQPLLLLHFILVLCLFFAVASVEGKPLHLSLVYLLNLLNLLSIHTRLAFLSI